jgi:hypothetical protein
MTKPIDTGSRHVTPAGGNVFADLGFSADEARQLQAQSNAEIAQLIALKKQLMGEISALSAHFPAARVRRGESENREVHAGRVGQHDGEYRQVGKTDRRVMRCFCMLSRLCRSALCEIQRGSC